MENHLELLLHCAKNNPNKFNQDKVLEECVEFMEAIIKRQTKHPNNPKRPDKMELIKEFGYLMYRGTIYLLQEFSEVAPEEIEIELQKHINKKLASLQRWKDNGEYKGGL